MADTNQAVDKKVTRPNFWKKIKGLVSVAVTGQGTMYASTKEGGWAEASFSEWKKNGTSVERLPDGRIRKEVDFERGKAKSDLFYGVNHRIMRKVFGVGRRVFERSVCFVNN